MPTDAPDLPAGTPAGSAPDLPTVADELYGLPPAKFVRDRDARAAAARDDGNAGLARQIAALRKPTAAAWALNLLVRRRRADVQRLLSLADRLRAGPADGEPGGLREVNRAAQRVVTAVTRLAGDLAADQGRPLTRALSDQVHDTLRAAMADRDAAAALLSGRLVTTLRATAAGGLGAVGPGAGEGVDLSDAVGVPVSVTSLAGRGAGRAATHDFERRERALAAARRDRDDAARDAADAERQAALAHERSGRLRGERDELTGAVDAARRALGELQERLAGLQDELDDTDREMRRLDDRADTARRRAREAADALGALGALDTPDRPDRPD